MIDGTMAAKSEFGAWAVTRAPQHVDALICMDSVPAPKVEIIIGDSVVSHVGFNIPLLVNACAISAGTVIYAEPYMWNTAKVQRKKLTVAVAEKQPVTPSVLNGIGKDVIPTDAEVAMTAAAAVATAEHTMESHDTYVVAVLPPVAIDEISTGHAKAHELN